MLLPGSSSAKYFFVEKCQGWVSAPDTLLQIRLSEQASNIIKSGMSKILYHQISASLL